MAAMLVVKNNSLSLRWKLKLYSYANSAIKIVWPPCHVGEIEEWDMGSDQLKCVLQKLSLHIDKTRL